MRRQGTALLCLLALSLVLPPSALGALSLTLRQYTDIAAFQFGGVGGLSFDPLSGELWIADAAGTFLTPGPGETNTFARIDPLTGVPSTLLLDAANGNVFLGPDALAWDPSAAELVMFSAFGDRTAGVTNAAGAPVRSLTIDSRQFAGAAFDAAGELWVADREQQVFNPDFLRRLDPLTGTTLASVEILGASFNPNLSALAFDPVTGNAFGYDTDQQVLLEIDLSSGNVLSETAVGAFVREVAVAGGIAFNATGDRLFLGSGVGLGHPTGITSDLVVLDRFAGTAIPLPAPLVPMATALAALVAGGRRWRERKD